VSSAEASLRVLLIGGAGQLGADLASALTGHEIIAPAHGELDVTDGAGLTATIARAAPDWVVSCAAFHDVDRSQDEPELAVGVNTLGAWNVARAAASAGARMAYVSTDYVFSGATATPYVESDRPDPLGVYGASKLAGEAMTRAACRDALVVRTAALFGRHPCRGKPGGRNFVDLMLRLGRERGVVRVIDSEIVSPTYTVHAAGRIRAAVEADLSGLLHVAGADAVSWRDFAIAILEEGQIDARVETARADEFPKKAPRPAYSALGSERDAELGGSMPGWRRGLAQYLAEVAP